MPSLVFYVEKIDRQPKLISSAIFSASDWEMNSKLKSQIKFAKIFINGRCRSYQCPHCAKKIKTSYRMMCHLKKHVRS
jgi:hypothetical protein